MKWRKRGLQISCLGVLVYLGFVLAAPSQSDEEGPKRVPPAEAYRPLAIPDRIILTWIGDPARSQAVTWRTSTEVKSAKAQLAIAEPGPKFVGKASTLQATTQSLKTDLGEAHYHTANFEGLSPKTKYVYRVGDGLNWSEWSHFQTASPDAEPFSFIYVGDAQNNIKEHWSRVIRQAFIGCPQARFLIHAGDLINKHDRDEEWGEWFNAPGWINATVPSIPTPGNHEYFRTGLKPSVSRHWRPQFALPENGPPGLEETTYYLDYQGVRIISLNSNESHLPQVEWVDKVLSTNSSKWTILTFHHPIYGAAKGRDNPTLRAAWQPVFDKHRVDLVLTGHDHTYARSELMAGKNVPNGAGVRDPKTGTVYVVSVSGPKMYRLEKMPWMKKSVQDTQLYQIISINGDKLKYHAHTAVGDLYDAFELRKHVGRPNELVEIDVPGPPTVEPAKKAASAK